MSNPNKIPTFESQMAKIKKSIEPYAVEGKYCSVCGTELRVEFDEDWDETGFVILPYLYCPKCERPVKTHKD